jgi:lantibiotic transport system ATP-binding protein
LPSVNFDPSILIIKNAVFMNCIEAIELRHQFYKGDVVLDNINLTVKENSIYGFLGANGAGKTTTLRLILGLLKKQQGDILIFGKPFNRHRIEILRKIGSLIESPSLYSHLTATENLMIWQKIYQCPKSRIPEVLHLVGLPDTKQKKASDFSLGMKQRLSIAVALLHNPTLLILDEPTNGLDPGGIVEIRKLLKFLNKEHGITILISSHLLAEIEKLVTDIGIINKGKMLFQGSLEHLMQQQQQASSMIIDTNNNDLETIFMNLTNA